MFAKLRAKLKAEYKPYTDKGKVAAKQRNLQECVTAVMKDLRQTARTREQSIEELKKIRETYPAIKLTQDIATAFGCPFEGEMPLDDLLKLIGKLRDIGIHAFTLCDTVGLAYPALVEKVFRTVKNEFPANEYAVFLEKRGDFLDPGNVQKIPPHI